MSIDVEEWFQVSNLRGSIPRGSWHAQERRLEQVMERMLLLMEKWEVKATCFVLGWIAERSPELVVRIAQAGHEIASHGYGHDLVHDLDRASFRDDIERSKRILEDLCGRAVLGYRAPSFSVTEWALPILRDAGFTYDSSLFPTTLRHSRYGKLDAQGARIVPTEATPVEVRLSCLNVGGHALPWAGGGYFRLLPYPIFRRGVRRILRTGAPYVFYIHPWELDAEQPRVRGLSRGERFRHYINLEKTESRWTSLLRDFDWMPIRDLITHEERRRRRRADAMGMPQRHGGDMSGIVTQGRSL
ncbi:MAG: DUF3473 domain-containing protein [Actinobacteria bacterium]|nr:DUF3473 domain-containing protein [Actinomycetota bacterium]